MRKCILFVAYVLLCACNLLKNVRREKESERTLSASNRNIKVSTENTRSLNAGYLLSEQGRADAAYTFQVWPKGKFTFSAAAGFAGEADSVRISGTKRKSGQREVQSETKSNTSAKVTVSQSQGRKDLNEQQLVKKTTSPSWKFIIAGLIVLVITGFWCYRKIKSV